MGYQWHFYLQTNLYLFLYSHLIMWVFTHEHAVVKVFLENQPFMFKVFLNNTIFQGSILSSIIRDK